MNLIIVESPTKAKTFTKLLKGDKYLIISSLGHIRELPEKKLSIDITQKFKPDYQLSIIKKEAINKIIDSAKKADKIYLATDLDREGEAIAYHIAFILGYITENWPISKQKKTNKLLRIVFHEITKNAIDNALKKPLSLNFNLIDAQQTRRILDRLVGYKISPLLWHKIGKRWLSAGRVQTIALRLIVEREKEINNFKKEFYYKIYADFNNDKYSINRAVLISYKNQNFYIKSKINLFDGIYTFSKTSINNNNLEQITKQLNNDNYKIESSSESSYKKNPPPPYITSTLQQDCSRLFGYSAKSTMRIAQKLYEKGYITYHRTDSLKLSSQFIKKIRKFIIMQYSEKYLSVKPRVYKTKNILAQEAHEAIRPTNIKINLPDSDEINSQHKKIYNLIFKRTIATQMSEAIYNTYLILIKSNTGYLFEKKDEFLKFEGFLIIYDKKANQRKINIAQINDIVKLNNLNSEENQTSPPPRYSEATLIKSLEEKGIGRPSTYAPIISTIQDKNYVEKKDTRFSPNLLGITISNYLSAAFPQLFSINFTATMENNLDNIAKGNNTMIDILEQFYNHFKKDLQKQSKDKGHIDVQEKTNEKCPLCKKSLVIRFSKYGKFVACSGYPKCTYKKSYIEKVDKKCPKCGADIIIRFTKRKKRFYGCNAYPKCNFAAWKISQIS